MYWANLTKLLIPSLLLLGVTGCTISHSACTSARGPIMFGGPCGDCTGCGERYVDPGINQPTKRAVPCPSCEGSLASGCHACRPIMSGVRNILGNKTSGPCDSIDRLVDTSCGIEESISCDGCSKCQRREPTCEIPEVTCEITEVTCGIGSVSIGRQHRPPHALHESIPLRPSIRHPKQQSPTPAPTIQRPTDTSQKYPMDTPRIYRNRANS